MVTLGEGAARSRKYAIHAEEQSLFAFLKQTFSQMPLPVRIFAYCVFLFLFSFLTLYEFLGITYYEGKVVYVYADGEHRNAIREGNPTVKFRIHKERDTFTNPDGEFFIGVHAVTIPFVDVDFEFDDQLSPNAAEPVTIPAPMPLVSLFNPNERKVYYVPGNVLPDSKGNLLHYFTDRTEAHDALKRSLQPGSSAVSKNAGFRGSESRAAPEIVYAAEPARPAARMFVLGLRELKVLGTSGAMDVYFEVRVDGMPIRVDKLPSAESSELNHVTVSPEAGLHFEDVNIPIPVGAGQVEIGVIEHRSFYQKDSRVGTVRFQPGTIPVGSVTLSDQRLLLTAQLFPPVAIATTAVKGKRNSYVLGLWLDIPKEYLDKVEKLEYDLGPGFEQPKVGPPNIERSFYYTYVVSIYTPQPIKARVDFKGGGSLNLVTLGDLNVRPPKSALDHFVLARAYAAANQYSTALDEVQSALRSDPTLLPALIWEGSVLADLGRYNEALAAYQKALRVDSSLPDALNGYAWLIADQMPNPTTAQLQEAKMRARQASALRQDGNSYDTLGWICYKLGDYTCALEALQTAKGKQDPSASAWQDINYHLGMVYLRLNKRQEARDALKEVIHYGSTFPTSQDKYVREAETQIASLK